jgi:hypothetical protein
MRKQKKIKKTKKRSLRNWRKDKKKSKNLPSPILRRKSYYSETFKIKINSQVTDTKNGLMDQDFLKLNVRKHEKIIDEINYESRRLKKLEKRIFSYPDFKELFFQTQKEWIRGKIQCILTPRTCMENRDLILEQFKEVYGKEYH